MTTSVAPNQISYRIGEDDGAWDTHTWKEAKNVIAAWYVGTSGRVRIQVDQPNAANWAPALRAHIRIGAAANAWNSLPVTEASASGTTGSFWVYDSANEAHAAVITATACGSTPSTWQNGNPGYHDTANPGAAQAVIRAEYTELEWSLKCLPSTRTGSTFFFRMTNDGTAFTTYSRLAQIKSKATVTSVSSFTTIAQSGTLKESAFATLTQAAKTKEETFTTLAHSAGFVESAFATLAQAASVVGAGFASFTTLSQIAAFVESAFDTLAHSGTLKEAAFTALAQAGLIKSETFSTLQQSGTMGETAVSTLAQSGAFHESGFSTLLQLASFAGEDTGYSGPKWRLHFPRRKPNNGSWLPGVRARQGRKD